MNTPHAESVPNLDTWKTSGFALAVLLLLAGLSAGTADAPLAYPISPVTLWDLTREADLVVLADVTDITNTEVPAATPMRDTPSSSRTFGAGAIAHLHVREVWKGETGNSSGTIEVAFEPNLICPAPPRYVAGKTTVAFLAKPEAGKADGGAADVAPAGVPWHTVALSYGTHYPAAGEIADYRDRVREARDLLARRSVPEADRLDWLVRAASRRATRWDGLYELMPQGDSLHSYYDQTLDARVGKARLTPAQYQTLAVGFVAQPSIDRTLPMFLALFNGRPHHALDRAAMGAVERILLSDRAPWWIGEAMTLLLRRLGDPAPEVRLAPLGDTFDDKDMRTIRDIWSRAKSELGLPDIPAVPDSNLEVGGVGANTPS
jgi:hypothetical protein